MKVLQCKIYFSVFCQIQLFLFIVLGDKPPRIDASRFPRTVTIKAGRSLDLEIPYDAYPTPMMSWSHNDVVIEPGPDNPVQTSIDSKKCKIFM